MMEPPSPDFMQNGINSQMMDLSSKIETTIEPNLGDYSEIQTDNNRYQKPTEDKHQNTKKYKIQSMFWLLNQKLYQDQELDSNEAMLTTIAFNIDFGNLRFEFYNITKQDAIAKNVMFLNEMDKLIDGVIYPADCFQIANKDTISLYPIEQLIIKTNEDWQKKRPFLHVMKDDSKIRLTIESYNGQNKYFFDFTNYQKQVFNYCCKYCVTTGMQIYGMAKI